MARQGLDGVNVHTYPDAPYELFRFSRAGGRWHARVMPEYYGLLAFALAAPPGSRLLNVSGSATTALSAWATRGPDRHIRVVLINRTGRQLTVGIRAATPAGEAHLARLTGPALTAQGGVSIAGQSFGAATYTGRLSGRAQLATIPRTGRTFVVSVPARSAALVELR